MPNDLDHVSKRVDFHSDEISTLKTRVSVVETEGRTMRDIMSSFNHNLQEVNKSIGSLNATMHALSNTQTRNTSDLKWIITIGGCAFAVAFFIFQFYIQFKG